MSFDEEVRSRALIIYRTQFYIAERKKEISDGFKKNKKAGAAEIGPATQLFTPEWIVRYLCENSLGRLWMQNNPNSTLKSQMEYYIAPDSETEGDNPGPHLFLKVSSAEDIRILDPACGSGHILVYAFDLLYAMYEEEGWLPEDIPAMILKNNLRGLEIDARAAEIAKFALEMKALERDPRFLEKNIDANIVVLEPVVFDSAELTLMPSLALQPDLLDVMEHMGEVGSLYIPKGTEHFALECAKADMQSIFPTNLFAESARKKLAKIESNLEALEGTYHCVIANPPYMGAANMNGWLSTWIKNNYPDVKSDLFSAFIMRNCAFAMRKGELGFMTPYVWMFISSYEKLRKTLIDEKTITTLIQLEYSGFSEATVPICTFTLTNQHIKDYKGGYVRLADFVGASVQSPKALEAIQNPACGWFYRTNAENFKSIPGWPIAYWMTKAAIRCFKNNRSLGEISAPRKGNSTSDNNRFLRRWYEVNRDKINIGSTVLIRQETLIKRWYPYNKGGDYRRWYGNNDWLIDWYDDGAAIRAIPTAVIANYQYYMKPGLTWSTVSSSLFNIRKFGSGYIFDNGGCCIFELGEYDYYLLALLNSSVFVHLCGSINPTLNFQSGDVSKFPVIIKEVNSVDKLSMRNECISRTDWDAFETSWDFSRHPLLSTPADEASQAESCPSEVSEAARSVGAAVSEDCLSASFARVPQLPRQSDERVASATSEGQDSAWEAGRQRKPIERDPAQSALLGHEFLRWQEECQTRFDHLKSNEEELNRIFAKIYNMEGEVPIEVPPDKVSVRLADKTRDIKSLISYGIGCIFGRYSLDAPGLILADQGATVEDYLNKVPEPSFMPDEDNILPILDDEWFEDDLVMRLYHFLAAAYGEGTLDENVAFIEDALGCSLRTYLVRDFYADHVRTYQKRPIYWLFQSPKKSFQCLIYMHRYTPSTVGEVLSKYLRPFEQKLHARISVLEQSERAGDIKAADKLKAQVAELEAWEKEVIYPLAHERVTIDLDDGVKVNYNKFPRALAKITGVSEWK